MKEILELSNSSIDRFLQCPLSYYHSKLNEDKPKQKGVVEFYGQYGTLIHFLDEFYPRTNFYMNSIPFEPSTFTEGNSIDNILNSYGNELMERGKPLTLEQMKVIYDDIFSRIDFPSEEKREEYYKQGLAHIEQIPQKDWSKVVGLEQKFKIDLQNGTPIISGVIDKVERDEKGIIITDYKTSKPYSANAALKKRQLPIYGMASYMLYGEIPYKYRYDFVRFDKTLEVTIPIERLTDVKNQIKFYFMQMETYRQQKTFPAQYSEFYCNNFCGYSYLCDRYQDFHGRG